MGEHGKLSHFVLFVFCASSASTHLEVCLLIEENCGYLCYDPSKYDCLSEGRVCDKNKIPCGDGFGRENSCYSPDTEYCADDELVCPIGHLTCESIKCYDPMTQNCTEAGACALGQDGCGDQCYSPDEQTCHFSYGMNFLCKKGQSICGYDCYDPINATCYATPYFSTICEKGQLGCAGQCYTEFTRS